MSENTDNTPARPTPLQLLAARQSPITDVVYGSDHPRKQPKRPPQKGRAAVSTGTSLVGDLLDQSTRNRLLALQGKLEARESRMNKGKEAS